MSEYQYHEWQTVDRALTSEEQAAVEDLSSHIEVSSSQAVVTYHWSSFRHDPRQVLLKYFDAYFYLANWGSLRLMFRFPKGLLEETELLPYLNQEYTSFESIGQYQVLDLDFGAEDGGEWMEETEADLSDFIRLRADLLEGDYRLLYLAWLKAETIYGDINEDDQEEDSDSTVYDLEPPVPPGLRTLSPALQNFIEVFDIDPFLVQAAAKTSADIRPPSAVDYRDLIARLSREECEVYLARLAEGEAGVRLSLRKRLNDFLPKNRPVPARPRTIHQLLENARQLKIIEAKRRAEAARNKHIAEMKSLAAREGEIWKQVETLLDSGRKIASVYDEATLLLEKLQQVAEFQDTRDAFQEHLYRLATKYASRPSLIDRWRKRGWV